MKKAATRRGWMGPSSAKHSWRVLGKYSNANQDGMSLLSPQPMSCNTPVQSNTSSSRLMDLSTANSFDISSINLTHAFHWNILWRPASSMPIWHFCSRTNPPIIVTEDVDSVTWGSRDGDSGVDSTLILVSICVCRLIDSSRALSWYLSFTLGANTFQLRLITEILCWLLIPELLYWGYWSFKYNAYAVRAFGASTTAKLCNWAFSFFLTCRGMARKQMASGIELTNNVVLTNHWLLNLICCMQKSKRLIFPGNSGLVSVTHWAKLRNWLNVKSNDSQNWVGKSWISANYLPLKNFQPQVRAHSVVERVQGMDPGTLATRLMGPQLLIAHKKLQGSVRHNLLMIRLSVKKLMTIKNNITKIVGTQLIVW